MSGSHKGHKRGHRRPHGGRHVQLYEWFQACPAWATLKPSPRALCVELKRRFNGSNNGRIVLSHRDAATALSVSRNTVGPYFEELEARGFIRKTRGACLGPSGVGESAHWALDEVPLLEGQEALKEFMRWRPPEPMQKPRPKIGTPRPDYWDGNVIGELN